MSVFLCNFEAQYAKMIRIMKRTALFTLLMVAVTSLHAQTPAIPRDAKLEAKVEKTLAKMTLDEKIGQMLELNLTAKRYVLYCSSMAARKQKSRRF